MHMRNGRAGAFKQTPKRGHGVDRSVDSKVVRNLGPEAFIRVQHGLKILFGYFNLPSS